MIYRRFFNFPESRLRSPFAELDGLRRQIDLLAGKSIPAKAGVFPLINLTENNDNYYVRAELPGIKADELDIEAEGNKISISGERKIPSENEKAKYHRIEREAGKFSRIISLQTDIDSDKIDATLKDGILKLTIPKSEKSKPKQITVH